MCIKCLPSLLQEKALSFPVCDSVVVTLLCSAADQHDMHSKSCTKHPETPFLLPIAENWVQPEKRERKQRVNYNQNQYFNQAMGTQGGR